MNPEKCHEIGKRIRTEREKLDLSREKLAELTGVSTYYIGQIERGERKMSLDTLMEVSSCLHLSIDYILRGVEPGRRDDALMETEHEKNSDKRDSDREKNQVEGQIYNLISRCSKKELELVRDMIKLVIPHIRG